MDSQRLCAETSGFENHDYKDSSNCKNVNDFCEDVYSSKGYQNLAFASECDCLQCELDIAEFKMKHWNGKRGKGLDCARKHVADEQSGEDYDFIKDNSSEQHHVKTSSMRPKQCPRYERDSSITENHKLNENRFPQQKENGSVHEIQETSSAYYNLAFDVDSEISDCEFDEPQEEASLVMKSEEIEIEIDRSIGDKINPEAEQIEGSHNPFLVNAIELDYRDKDRRLGNNGSDGTTVEDIDGEDVVGDKTISTDEMTIEKTPEITIDNPDDVTDNMRDKKTSIDETKTDNDDDFLWMEAIELDCYSPSFADDLANLNYAHIITTDRFTTGKCQEVILLNHHAHNTDGLAQECSNSSVLAMELLQSCTKPLI